MIERKDDDEENEDIHIEQIKDDETEKMVRSYQDDKFEPLEKDEKKMDSRFLNLSMVAQQHVPEVEHKEGMNIDFLKQRRNVNSIRRGFLSKLTYEKIWLTPSQKPKIYETVIIFDWDDTILCTSFINPTGVFNPNQRIEPHVMK